MNLLGAGHVQAGIRGKETFIGDLDATLTNRARVVADDLVVRSWTRRSVPDHGWRALDPRQ